MVNCKGGEMVNLSHKLKDTVEPTNWKFTDLNLHHRSFKSSDDIRTAAYSWER
jgi:hypothetical protein